MGNSNRKNSSVTMGRKGEKPSLLPSKSPPERQSNRLSVQSRIDDSPCKNWVNIPSPNDLQDLQEIQDIGELLESCEDVKLDSTIEEDQRCGTLSSANAYDASRESFSGVLRSNALQIPLLRVVDSSIHSPAVTGNTPALPTPQRKERKRKPNKKYKLPSKEEKISPQPENIPSIVVTKQEPLTVNLPPPAIRRHGVVVDRPPKYEWKKIRGAVWKKYFGSHPYGLCFCCCRKVTRRNWHCSHVVSIRCGGTNTVDNLRVCCSKCNLSMGTMHMYIYILSNNLNQCCAWDIILAWREAQLSGNSPM